MSVKTTLTTNSSMGRSNEERSRQNKTQTASFKKRIIHTPIKSQKSLDELYWLKTQNMLSKHYRIYAGFSRCTAVTSTNWCMYDSNCNSYVGVREDQQREVASLTKIMTTIISIELFHKYSLDEEMLVRVSRSSASHIGTSAELKEGKYVRLYDLLYGTMLPSGNDAAYLLAEVFGLLLFYQSVKPDCKQYSEIESIDLTCYDSTITFINRFLKEMNKKAKQLRLNKTVFSNPHGLANILNVSSAKEILLLSKYCVKNTIFRSIMNSSSYTTTIYENEMRQIYKQKTWTNTNILLSKGWEGIKTGHTTPAGGCLSSLKDGIYIVVLNCQTKDTRFHDTQTLYSWQQNHLNLEGA